MKEIYKKYLKITCNEATYLLTKRQSDGLNIKEWLFLQFHLSVCVPCSQFAKQIIILENQLKKHYISLKTAKHTFNKEKKEEMQKQIDISTNN